MRTILFFLLAWFLLSCEPRDTIPPATTPRGSSGGSSTGTAVGLNPANWRFFVGDKGSQGNPNNYQATLVTGPASTSSSSPLGNTGIGVGGIATPTTSYTLGLSTTMLTDTASYCSWAYGLYPPTTLRVGKSLTLKAKVRLEQVQGKGVSLVLRGDRVTQTAALFATTEGKTKLVGTSDFTEYSVTLPYSSAVDVVVIYVVLLSNTSGSVWISDVSLQIN